MRTATIPEMMAQDHIPGVSIAFVDGGQLAWTRHYGYANLEDSTRVASSTVFTGASLSKPITAMAALRLVESGKLNLDEDVNQQLTSWKVPENEWTATEKVTLRRLIGHSAGIKNDLWSSYLPDETVPTLTQMLAGKSPSVDPATSLIREPGSKVSYSNPGYSIIQQLLMDVSGQAFAPLIDELVFSPVGMKHSSFLQPLPEHLMAHRATGYTENLEPYPYRLFPYQAAGGIWTTPTDLAQFLIALLDDHHKGTQTLVSQQTTQTVFKKFGGRFVFSLWDWGEDIVFMHSGSNQGFNCILFGSLAKNQGVVVMTNSDNAFGFFDYVQRAISHEYQWEYVRPEIHEPVTKALNWVDPFLGEYPWRDQKVRFRQVKDQLWLAIEDQKVLLTQTDERTFIEPERPLKITFPENTEGRITIWEPSGYPYRIKVNP
ncbi:MAG: serine hydrolase domain-containing protein [Salibacteraceae bacterium]